MRRKRSFSPYLSVQVKYINKAAGKVQWLKKWFIDTLGLLKQGNVNAINFWIKSVHCKVQADRMALKPHPEQNVSINEHPASEEEPASDKADPLSVKKKRISFVGNCSSNAPVSSIMFK